MCFRQQSTVSIDRQVTTELDTAILNKPAAFSTLTEPRLFKLLNDLEGKAVLDLGKIHIGRSNARYLKSFRCGNA